MKFKKRAIEVIVDSDQQYKTGKEMAGVFHSDETGFLSYTKRMLHGETGELPEKSYPRKPFQAFVVTIHGTLTPVVDGDWIMPEPDGVHYYPVKDEVFRATYDPID